MQQVMVRITGTSPMMMHNRRLANPLDYYVKEIKKYTGKRTKTDEDHLQIARLEFKGGIYHDDKTGVYTPGENIEATIKNGAKIMRKGTDVSRAVMVLEDKIPLEHDGARKALDWLFDNGYADIRVVSSQGKKGGAKVMRCRPIFNPPWTHEFTLLFDPEIISPDDLRLCVDKGGNLIGLNDGRPRYGRFQIDEWELS